MDLRQPVTAVMGRSAGSDSDSCCKLVGSAVPEPLRQGMSDLTLLQFGLVSSSGRLSGLTDNSTNACGDTDGNGKVSSALQTSIRATHKLSNMLTIAELDLCLL